MAMSHVIIGTGEPARLEPRASRRCDGVAASAGHTWPGLALSTAKPLTGLNSAFKRALIHLVAAGRRPAPTHLHAGRQRPRSQSRGVHTNAHRASQPR